MLLAWLLPQAGATVLTDGWSRTVYQPRHVRPPLILRIGRQVAAGRAGRAGRAWTAVVGNVILDSEIWESAGER
jgi:hypothetical protein